MKEVLIFRLKMKYYLIIYSLNKSGFIDIMKLVVFIVSYTDYASSYIPEYSIFHQYNTNVDNVI
jgi:hypothetical protein